MNFNTFILLILAILRFEPVDVTNHALFVTKVLGNEKCHSSLVIYGLSNGELVLIRLEENDF